MKAHRNLLTLVALTCALAFTSATAFGQTTTFTYQGKLNDAGVPANAAYDMQFKAFDAPNNGNQLGSTVTNPSVQVTNGIFSLELDFGALTFQGQDVFLEIAVRPTGNPNPYTLLLPRQRVSSAPYAIQSLKALSAGDAANLGGTAANLYVQTSDSRMTDARPPTAGSPNYLQNTTAPQAISNFNISGNGAAGGILSANAVTSATQYNIGGSRVLSIAGTRNTFTGVSTGAVNTSGLDDSFFGNLAGAANSSGGNNSFFGSSAGSSNTTASFNAFFGAAAGSFSSTGDSDSFFGSSAGRHNTTGSNNSFFGIDAGRENATADGNSFFGASAGQNNTADGNSFFGRQAGQANTGATGNSFFGNQAGKATTTSLNSFFGSLAGAANTSGFVNSFFGANAGTSNLSGAGNSFFGSGSGKLNTTGQSNSFFGNGAGNNNKTGADNSFFGATAGQNNTAGANSFFGSQAGLANTTGTQNTFVGQAAGIGNLTGSSNTAVGYNAGLTSDAGSGNTFLGANADSSTAGLTNATAIGAGATVNFSHNIVLGTDLDHTRIPGQISVAGPISATSITAATTITTGGQFTAGGPIVGLGSLNVDGTSRLHLTVIQDLGVAGGTQLCRNATHEISTCSSSLRYKTNIAPFTAGLSIVNRLRPITFDWKVGGMHDLGFGAEEVEKIDPLLVTYNDKGQVEGVKYDRISVALVNAMKEQQAEIKQQQKQLQQQQLVIAGLRKLVCSQNANADVCREGK